MGNLHNVDVKSPKCSEGWLGRREFPLNALCVMWGRTPPDTLPPFRNDQMHEKRSSIGVNSSANSMDNQHLTFLV